jgi:hypothetical protein
MVVRLWQYSYCTVHRKCRALHCKASFPTGIPQLLLVLRVLLLVLLLLVLLLLVLLFLVLLLLVLLLLVLLLLVLLLLVLLLLVLLLLVLLLLVLLLLVLLLMLPHLLNGPWSPVNTTTNATTTAPIEWAVVACQYYY